MIGSGEYTISEVSERLNFCHLPIFQHSLRKLSDVHLANMAKPFIFADRYSR